MSKTRAHPSVPWKQRESNLKHILFNIARLSSVDQRWILRRLTPSELNTFNQYHGLKRLEEAQRFRTLKADDASMPLQPSREPLPTFCQELSIKTPLYTAIIIEQGGYSWTTQFLEQFDEEGVISALLENQVFDLKIAVKKAVFKEWERSICFEHLLDDPHG